MHFDKIYYIQINLFCLILLLILYTLLRYEKTIRTTANKFFVWLVVAASVVCISDLGACSFDGMVFPGARSILQLSNMFYYISITAVSYTWFLYLAAVARGKKANNVEHNVIAGIPIVVMTILTLINPWTDFVYSFDENNVYSRGPGVVFHWVVSCGYLLLSLIISIVFYTRAKTKAERRYGRLIIWFNVFPAMGAALQIIFPGTTFNQCAIVLSVLMIVCGSMQNRAFKDSLTNMNNRAALSDYFRERLKNHPREISVCMMDIDSFKTINDVMGHLAGDRAIETVAGVLQEVSDSFDFPMFLCRYGGDEFLMVCEKTEREKIIEFENGVSEKLKTVKYKCDGKRTISLSFGFASAECASSDEAEKLVGLADEDMYNNKLAKKAKLNENA